jgi:hypothetical protein
MNIVYEIFNSSLRFLSSGTLFGLSAFAAALNCQHLLGRLVRERKLDVTSSVILSVIVSTVALLFAMHELPIIQNLVVNITSLEKLTLRTCNEILKICNEF